MLFEILFSGRVVPFGALLTTKSYFSDFGAIALTCQRLGCFQLLRLLQGFLGHFVSPSVDLPYWASAHVYAKQSPNSAAAPRNRNPLNLRHFASQLLSSQPAAHPHGVELIITC